MSGGILQSALIVSLLGGMIRIVVPILYASLGELIVERSGILNLSVEGGLTIGAFAGFAIARQTGSLWLGVLCAGLAGSALALIMAFLCITLKQDQTISGLALNLFAGGLSFYIYRVLFKDFLGGNMPTVTPFREAPIPGLASIPIIGPSFFSQHVLAYAAFLLVPLIFFFLYRTKYGLALRCLGENPRTVDMKGLNVAGMQYAALLVGGFLYGIGGCCLTLASAGMFVDGIASGRGWIAIAIVIFGGWKPWNILGASLFFAFLESLQNQVQSAGFNLVPYQFVAMLPYVVTILVLLISRKRSGAPLALGLPYTRE
jgi:general nucleoside transport system permease protein